MKKLLILKLLLFFIFTVNAQNRLNDLWSDSFNTSFIDGTDTVLYKYNEDTLHGTTRPGFGFFWCVEFKIIEIGRGCTDAIIDIGYSQDGTTFTSFSTVTGGSTIFPYTVAGSDSASVNGVQKLSKGDFGEVFAPRYFAIKITKGSCAAAGFSWIFTQH